MRRACNLTSIAVGLSCLMYTMCAYADIVPLENDAPVHRCDNSENLSKSEKMICSEQKLAQLDELLQEMFSAAQSRASAVSREDLVAEQRAFIAERDACEKADRHRECVLLVTERKIVALELRFDSIPPFTIVTYTCNKDPQDQLRVKFFIAAGRMGFATYHGKSFLLYAGQSSDPNQYEGGDGARMIIRTRGDIRFIPTSNTSERTCMQQIVDVPASRQSQNRSSK